MAIATRCGAANERTTNLPSLMTTGEAVDSGVSARSELRAKGGGSIKDAETTHVFRG